MGRHNNTEWLQPHTNLYWFSFYNLGENNKYGVLGLE